MGVYRRLVRPLLFALPADRAHVLAQRALRWPAPWALFGAGQAVDDPRLRVQLAGMELSNPVGLAAGFDKDGDALPALRHLGFGYLVVGSIMPQPRAGNPLPRNVRYPRRESLA